MVQVHQLDPYKVQEILTLKDKPREGEAREMLESVARQVQPILRRRQYTVPLLREFYPRNPCLLGLNVGGGGGGTREISVRLRPAGREGEFLPYESVLGTMLHEITHNIHGPHDAKFYKLLDELTKECEELMAKGISGSGAGFDAPAAGKAGGRFVGRELPGYQLRELARQAAEARLKRQAVMSAGPRTAGGDLSLRHLPPSEAAAAAAQRRLRDNTWCPTEVLGEEAGAGHNVDAALQAILNNAGAQQAQRAQQVTLTKAGAQHGRSVQQASAVVAGPRHAQQQLAAPLQQQQQQQQQQPQQHRAPAGPALPAFLDADDAAGAVPAAAGARQQAGVASGKLGLRARLAQVLGKSQGSGSNSPGGQVPAAVEPPEGEVGAAVGAPAAPAAAVVLGRPAAALGAAAAAAAEEEGKQPRVREETAALQQPVARSRSWWQQQPHPQQQEQQQQQQRQQQQQQQSAEGRGREDCGGCVVDLTMSSDDDDGGEEKEVQQAQRPSKRAGQAWTCPACTLANKPLALTCEACLGVRPAGWG